jgi:hypothetical protein
MPLHVVSVNTKICRVHFSGIAEYSSFECGNPLWLLGVYAPIGKKSFFKMSKNSEKTILACVYTFYVHSPSFVIKIIIFVTCVKKTIFYATKLLFT